MQWRGIVGNLTREDWSGWAKWPPWVVSVKAAHNRVRPHLDGEDIGMKRGEDTGYRRHRRYSGGYRGYRGRGGTNKAGFPHCSFYHRALWPTKAIVPPPPFFLLCLRKTPTGAIPTNSTAWHSWLFSPGNFFQFQVCTGWTKSWQRNLCLWFFTLLSEINSPPTSTLGQKKRAGRSKMINMGPTNQLTLQCNQPVTTLQPTNQPVTITH